MLSSPSDRRRHVRDLGAGVAIVAIALIIGCVGVTRSGPLWVDGPQYANAGAMIRDWIRSGQLLHPFEFARANYAQYPAFSVPYHPPGYPGLLGAFFLMTGVSYSSARVFIALLLGLAGCSFYAILRRFAVDRGPAFVCTLLLLTMPEIVTWSRDTMSEIPALAFVLVGSFGFLRWLETVRYRDAAFAFGFAALAFFSKINVIGVLLAWPFWIALRGPWRKMFSPSFVVPAVLFVAVVAGWSIFFIPFARYETQSSMTSAHGAAPLPDANLLVYLYGLPAMTGWSMLVVSVLGLGVALHLPEWRRSAAMWLAWFGGCLVFLLMLPLHYEARYLVFALPALAALAAMLFFARTRSRVPEWIAYALAGVALVENVVRLRHQSSGVTGYKQMASRLAALNEPGNVLIGVPFQNDLIFRYRSASPESRRQFIRGDRSITMSLPTYAPDADPSRLLVKGPESFLDLIRRGRVRYVVTVPPAPDSDADDQIVTDMRIAARNVAALPQEFAPVDSFWIDFGGVWPEPDMWVYLWRFRHQLPEGPSEIPITIPTAGLIYRPKD